MNENQMKGVAIGFLSFLLFVNNFVSKLATFYSLIGMVIVQDVILMRFFKGLGISFHN